MKRIVIALLAVLAVLSVNAQIGDLPRATPESQGVKSEKILAAFDSLMAYPNTEIHGLMVLRHGKVIAEMHPTPFKPEYQHILASCSKTFVSAAVGLCVDDNKLQVADRVLTFFPELAPDTISDNLAAMTVHNLLTMGSGITPDWVLRDTSETWIKSWLAKPVDKPGRKFLYDSMSTYMLSAIVQRVSGKTVLELLQERIFNALNINVVDWEISPEGCNTGGWGLNLQTESLAKFGQLLLQNGNWNGEQLLSEEWVRQMMTAQVNHQHGYGYQMWGCEHPNTWRADGAFGQYIAVAPQEDMVIVLTQCMRDNPVNERNIMWNNLLHDLSDTPLQEGRGYDMLKAKNAQYHLAWPQGKPGSSTIDVGKNIKIALGNNILNWTSITIKNEAGKYSVEVQRQAEEKFSVPLGYKSWQTTATRCTPPYNVNAVDRFKGVDRDFIVAGSYAWLAKNKIEFIVQWVNWISMAKVSVEFGSAGKATVVITYNLEGYNKPMTVDGHYTRFVYAK